MLSSQGWASNFGSFTSKFSWYAGSKDTPVVSRCDSAVTQQILRIRSLRFTRSVRGNKLQAE